MTTVSSASPQAMRRLLDLLRYADSFAYFFGTVLLGLACFSDEAAAGLRYYVQPIEPTSSSESNSPTDLNNLGVGTGTMFSGTAGRDRGLVLRDGQTSLLPALPANPLFTKSDAYGINNAGAIVGSSTVGVGVQTSAFLFTEELGIVDLGSFGSFQSVANAINDQMQVVGSYGASGAFLWENGAFTDLGHLGGMGSSALDINSSGDVVGYSERPDGGVAPFLWSDLDNDSESDPGEMIDLGAVPGLPHAFATALNDAGSIVGYGFSNASDSPHRAFRWEDADSNHQSDDGELVVLQVLSPDVARTFAYDINNRGEIVGASTFSAGGPAATLWANGQVQDLNQWLVWPSGVEPINLSSAEAINDRGQILAQGLASTPLGLKSRGFLLTPVPEPAASGLLLAALCLARMRPRLTR